MFAMTSLALLGKPVKEKKNKDRTISTWALAILIKIARTDVMIDGPHFRGGGGGEGHP